MTKLVLTSRIVSDYDDLREQRFHFPKERHNWETAHQAVGDWILYYEPRPSGLRTPRFGGKQAYFAVALVESVDTDRRKRDHGYIHVSSYTEFERSVSFRSFYESSLKRADGSINRNAFQRSIRPIPDAEFEIICQAGFPSGAPALRSGSNGKAPITRKLSLDMLLERPVRDYMFRQQVLETYGNRCAISGLELYDRSNHPEVIATHIRPWSMGGADVARNGLPLSGTIAWMFRRGLITLTNDLEIVRARALPKQLEVLLPHARAFNSTVPKFKPHESYLEFHRENIFEHGSKSSSDGLGSVDKLLFEPLIYY